MPIDDDHIPSAGGGHDTGGALDGMDADFAKFREEQAAAAAPAPAAAPAGDTAPAPAPAPNGDTLNGDAAAPAAKPGDAAAPAAKPEDKPKTDDEPDDEFKKFQLPKHARGETNIQFKQTKELGRKLVGEAKQETAAVRSELETLKAKYAELEKGGAAKPEDLEELRQLREWSRLNDFENSPDFRKKFVDGRAKAESEALDALKEAGYNEEAIAKVKEFGGILGVDLEKLAAPMNTLQREAFFEPIRRILSLDKERKAAIEQAKADKTAFDERVKALPDPIRADRDLAVKGAEQMLEGSNFFKPLDLNALPPNISKELAVAYNDGGSEAQKWLTVVKEKLAKGEPIMHEVLAVGAAAQRYLKVNAFLNTKAADAEKRAADAEKRAKDAEEKLTRYKAAGAAPRTPTDTPKPVANNPFGVSDDMDADFRKFVEEGAGGAIPRS